MSITINNSYDSMMDYVNLRLKNDKTAIKNRGEVFTPISLVNEMLDLLPQSVWSNPSLKWLDPANGIGNFPICVYYRLMDGLSSCEVLPKNIENTTHNRSYHIIKNMLYMMELDADNVSDSFKIFSSDANIIQGDFLKTDVKETLELSAFNIIMGNPPYQKKIGGKKNTQPIWYLFVKKSLTLLQQGGYLLLVHPSGWRAPSGIYRDIFISFRARNLEYLSMNSFNKGKQVFNMGTNYDYYLLRNNITDTNITRVKDIDDNILNINLNNWEFIPSGYFDIFRKILSTSSEKVDILYERSMYGTDKVTVNHYNIYHAQKPHMSKTPTIISSQSTYETRKPHMSKTLSVFKYPCVYTITRKGHINLRYSSEDRGMFNIPKVIWSNGAGTYPIIDMTGKYGLTQFSYGLVDDPSNLEYIKKAMDTPEFIKLMSYVKFSQSHKYNHKVIALFKKDFYKYF